MYSWKSPFGPHVFSIVLGFDTRYSTWITIICCFLKITWFTLTRTINLDADVSFGLSLSYILASGLSSHMVVITHRSHKQHIYKIHKKQVFPNASKNSFVTSVPLQTPKVRESNKCESLFVLRRNQNCPTEAT